MAPVLPTTSSPSPSQPAAPRCKFRVRFRKAGDLRLVSHHDLMHVVERMFRRADLPIPTSQGFNPRPRMWFALSLALGVAGLNEILELEVDQPMEAAELSARLIKQAPPGIDILSVQAIDVKLSARVRRALYRLPLSDTDARPAIDSFLALAECWTERSRPNPRRVNIRPFVSELRQTEDSLTMALWITPTGAARPEEIIIALGLKDLLDGGAVIERTDLEVQDELPPGTPGPPVIQAALQELRTNGKPVDSPRPTALVGNPLSFDS